ncbi:unnamed protein product [Brachionus calyciflorus]|uniref:G-patch domain-containing protein n=1 Tax=Brachionus calyciflorus TaxID=104777 RepID=A0A813MJ27_9BILA|nr:unnamed protein product [Brachionus calyciflorus]
MDHSSNDLSQNSTQTLFKQNYKFINFQKSSDTKNLGSSNDESIKDFYHDLIKTNQSDQSENMIDLSEPDDLEIIEIKNPNELKIDPKDFLKAVNNGDTKIVLDYINNNGDVLVLDSFKWNALMISIAASNNQMVKFLFENIKDKQAINQLLLNSDSSGNSAETLAEKFKNTDIINLIKDFRIKNETSETNIVDLEEDDEIEILEENEFFCESCQKSFKFKDKSHNEHLTSIAHLINENMKDTERQKRILANYHLRGTNKGYQLMLKSGWNELGLGANEQGRVMPVKTRIKLDRLGIGIDTKSKPYTRPIRSLKLKSSRSDSQLLKQAKNLKDTLEANKRLQKRERELRRYFDS